MLNKVALFFGSFNPIHIGHLAIANYVVEYTDVEQLWFVVSAQNPLKKKNSLLSNHHRLALVRTALEYETRMKLCDIELSLPQPSFTIDTLTYLTEKYPQYEFVILMGADGLIDFHKWKNYQELIQRFQRYIYPRPGVDITSLPNIQNCIFIDAPLIEISSTFIRQGIKDKRNMRYFLHHKVWEYISEMHFYKK
jgi:nicotinate-nucleotide adenylyltransferase